MVSNNIFDTAVVFEGGGMRASYSAGVVAALLEAGVHSDFVAGISAGSSCTVNYVSRDAARARRSFVDLAQDPRFGNLRTFLTGKGMFSAEWIYEHTSAPDQPLPFNWSAWEANPAQVAIGALRCDTGETVYWGREDLDTMPYLMKRVRASSSMPIIMPLTVIDDVAYVDGALGTSGGIALDAAQAAGYERFIVVLTRERDYRKRRPINSGLYRGWFRRYPAVADAILTRHQRYNATLDALAEHEREGRALVIAPKVMPISNSERSVAKLASVFEQGLGQARREMGTIREFAGLPSR